jgi:hypothetical protein
MWNVVQAHELGLHKQAMKYLGSMSKGMVSLMNCKPTF